MRLALKTNAMHDEEHGASAKQRNIQKLSSKKMKSIGPACTHPLKRKLENRCVSNNRETYVTCSCM